MPRPAPAAPGLFIMDRTKYEHARARERVYRMLSHLHVAPLLEIPMLNPRLRWRIQLTPLTERKRLELVLAANAFFNGRAPLLGDVFVFLWRLHPHYTAPRAERRAVIDDLPHRRFRLLRLWWAFGSLKTALIHRSLTAKVQRCDLFGAATAIREFLADAEQDAPTSESEDVQSTCAPQRCHADELCAYFMKYYHMTHAEVMDAPCALLNQIYRSEQLNRPNGEVLVMDRSEELYFEEAHHAQ